MYTCVYVYVQTAPLSHKSNFIIFKEQKYASKATVEDP